MRCIHDKKYLIFKKELLKYFKDISEIDELKISPFRMNRLFKIALSSKDMDNININRNDALREERES